MAAAYATYRIVEDPVRHARRLARGRWTTILLGLALVATSLAVATVALAVHRTTPRAPTVSATAPIPSYTPAQVRRMIDGAPAITTLPSDLTPSLENVRDDWGGPTGPCWPTYAQASVPACLFGDPHGARTMVLYGDSHAAMWFDAVDLIAVAAHWRLALLAKGDCEFADLTFRTPAVAGSSDTPFAACASWHAFALARMDQLHPDLVVATQAYNLGPGGVAFSGRAWERGTEDAIRSFPVPADRVVVLGNIPQTATSGPQCLTLHPDAVQRCSSPVLPYVAQTDTAERRAAASTGARYVDMVPWFCSTTCTGVIGRYQPYLDPFHVTAAYSFALRGVLTEELDLPAYASSPGPSTTTAATTPAG